jgi:predicted Zn-dependent peptidase
MTSFTQSEATREAVELALSVLYRLRNDGIGEEMLRSARNYILGLFPTRLETASQLAAQFAMLELYGVGRDYVDGYGKAIRAVTVESLRPVIQRVYPPGDELVFVFIGDAATIRDTVSRYGALSEQSITDGSFGAPAAAELPD